MYSHFLNLCFSGLWHQLPHYQLPHGTDVQTQAGGLCYPFHGGDRQGDQRDEAVSQRSGPNCRRGIPQECMFEMLHLYHMFKWARNVTVFIFFVLVLRILVYIPNSRQRLVLLWFLWTKTFKVFQISTEQRGKSFLVINRARRSTGTTGQSCSTICTPLCLLFKVLLVPMDINNCTFSQEFITLVFCC